MQTTALLQFLPLERAELRTAEPAPMLLQYLRQAAQATMELLQAVLILQAPHLQLAAAQMPVRTHLRLARRLVVRAITVRLQVHLLRLLRLFLRQADRLMPAVRLQLAFQPAVRVTAVFQHLPPLQLTMAAVPHQAAEARLAEAQHRVPSSQAAEADLHSA